MTYSYKRCAWPFPREFSGSLRFFSQNPNHDRRVMTPRRATRLHQPRPHQPCAGNRKAMNETTILLSPSPGDPSVKPDFLATVEPCIPRDPAVTRHSNWSSTGTPGSRGRCHAPLGAVAATVTLTLTAQQQQCCSERRRRRRRVEILLPREYRRAQSTPGLPDVPTR